MGLTSKLSAFLGLAALAALPAGAEQLGVGDAAPDFTLTASDGTETTLSEVIGEKNVVLAFFPKAFTPG